MITDSDILKDTCRPNSSKEQWNELLNSYGIPGTFIDAYSKFLEDKTNNDESVIDAYGGISEAFNTWFF